MQRHSISAWRYGLAVVVVAAGVASNIASNFVGPAPECEESSPLVLTAQGSAQTGAATAPLGQPLALRVQCLTKTAYPLDKEDVPVVWSVESGGGLVNGLASTTVSSGWLDGRSSVLWQLGPAMGAQVVVATVNGRTFRFEATAIGAASGGTCAGGAGTDLTQGRQIVGTETWTLAGSPYRGETVTVASGGVLKVEPGVTSCLANLTVALGGRLQAVGEPGNPVRMRPVFGLPTGWFLEFSSSSTDFRLQTLPSIPLSTVKHAELSDVGSLSMHGRLLFEDSQAAALARINNCGSFRWSLDPAAIPTAGMAVRRVVFTGFGGSQCTSALALYAKAVPPEGPMPFEARVLGVRGDALHVSGDAAGPAFALANCEVSGAGSKGISFDSDATGGIATVSRCNLTGNTGFALENLRPLTSTIDARGNFWGAAGGPSISGANAISSGVNAADAAAAPFALGY